MSPVELLAPVGEAIRDYDRDHLALYAALLDADLAGRTWMDAADTIMRIDVTAAEAKTCWRSHLERARWIVGKGLAAAIEAFGEQPAHTQ